MQTLTQPLLETIINIAKAAGEQLKQLYARSVAIKIKADCTPVTGSGSDYQPIFN
ncbi:hypothetical protein NJNGDCLN_01162 [Mannheimia haemolytica]